jgi:hypothetical protein
MPSLNLNISNDLTPDGIDAELRALKLAVALIATRLPEDLNPHAIPTSLKGTGDAHASKLADLIQQFLDEAHKGT